MGKLRNLEHVFDLAAENFSRYEGRDFVLPLVLKERVNNKINELWFSIAEGKGTDENERLAINSINSKWTIKYKII